MSQDSRIRVVIADDHPIVREGLINLIEDEADMVVVGEAIDGRSAVELFHQYQPDVLLIDLRMPNLSGCEATAQIRQDSPNARIIILTTYDTEEDIYSSLRAGAMAYLLKDAPRHELITAIRTVHAGQQYIAFQIGTKLAQYINEPVISDRERDVLQLLAQGNSNREIAQALGITEGTVKHHVNSILSKFEVNDRTHAVVVALKRGIVQF